jgi:peroxiredoxin
MKTIIGLSLALSAAMLSAGPTGPGSSTATTYAFPRFQFQPGHKMCYSSSTTTEYARGSWTTIRQFQVWVMQRNPDSSYHLILNQAETSVFEPKGGERSANGPDMSWGWCDLRPDGSIVPGSKLGQVDPSVVFIPLPEDTMQAKKGWERTGDLDERDQFRLDSKSLTDSVWAIEENVKTPLDDIYLISNRELIRLNVKQGLLVSKEGHATQSYGNRTSTSSFSLDSITKLDSGEVVKFLPDLSTYLLTDSPVTALMNQADEQPEQALDLLGKADAMLELYFDSVRDSGLQALMGQRIDEISDAVKRAKEAGKEKTLKSTSAPGWKLTDLDGKTHTLKQYRGRVVVLDFWYRGCPWCIRAMPQVNQLALDFQDKPVQVLGMNIDMDTVDARFVVDKLKLSYPNLRAGEITKKYGVTGYPTVFVIDKKGIIRDIDIGYSPDVGVKLRRAVQALLESK